jgi:ACS family glucarate transporter-like MFS transporter/ACS family D-galactonate transporter-like MFS transporter
MSITDSPSAARPTNIRWAVFALAFGTSGLLYLHRYVFAFVKPTLAVEYGLSNTELGKLDSAFSLCYTLFQFPLGVVADAAGVHLVLGGLILVWCGGLAMLAWAPSVNLIWFAQATHGTGQSAVYACLNRIARMWYPPAVRTTLQGAVGVLAGRLGALGSSLLFTTLLLGVLELDWRTAIWILVAVGVVHMACFAVVFRNSPREHPAVNDAEARLIEADTVPTPAESTTPTRSVSESGSSRSTSEPFSVRSMLRATTPRSLVNLLCLAVQSILSTFADNIYSNWIPLFLAQVHGLKFKEMGIYSALPLLGGAIGGLAGGILNDYFIARTRNRRWSRVGVAFAGKGVAAALMVAALLAYDRPYVFCAALFFVKFFSDWSLTTSLGVVTDIGGRATASVFAFNNSVAGIGFITAPIVFGAIADKYDWRLVFVTVAATYALCALSWLLIDCTIPVASESRSRGIQPTPQT